MCVHEFAARVGVDPYGYGEIVGFQIRFFTLRDIPVEGYAVF